MLMPDIILDSHTSIIKAVEEPAVSEEEATTVERAEKPKVRAMEETKVIYYIDDEETPYLMKILKSPEKVTLGDFKGQLNKMYQKFFFKSVDDDFG